MSRISFKVLAMCCQWTFCSLTLTDRWLAEQIFVSAVWFKHQSDPLANLVPMVDALLTKMLSKIENIARAVSFSFRFIERREAGEAAVFVG